MAHSRALIHSLPLVSDTFGTAFVRDAYRAARGTPTWMPEDADVLRACCVQFASAHAIDLGTAEGITTAQSGIAAFLSLGIGEASEEQMADAIALLQEKPLDWFVAFGRSLHEEIRKDAQRKVRAAVLTTADRRWYGLLDVAAENRLRAIADHRTFFPTASAYALARRDLVTATHSIALAAAFPIAYLTEAHHYVARYYQETFRRTNAETPNARGGLLALCLRSLLIRALGSDDPDKLPIAASARDTHAFLGEKFVIRADNLRTLVEDAFFETARVAERLPAAMAVLDRYLRQPFQTMGVLGAPSFQKRSITDRGVLHAAQACAEESLRTFIKTVRAMFTATGDVDVSPAQLNAFWGGWVITYGVGTVDTQTLAAGGGSADLATLLRIPPSELDRYLVGASAWSPELQRAFALQYPWVNVARSSMQEAAIIDCLDTATRALGPEVIARAGVRRLPLRFWLRAWDEGSKELRDAILAYFQSGNAPVHRTVRTILTALMEIGGLGGDARLFAWLLDECMRGSASPYLEHGVSVGTWASLLQAFGRDPNALRVAYRYIPPAKRDRVLDALPQGPAWQVRLLTRT